MTFYNAKLEEMLVSKLILELLIQHLVQFLGNSTLQKILNYSTIKTKKVQPLKFLVLCMEIRKVDIKLPLTVSKHINQLHQIKLLFKLKDKI